MTTSAAPAASADPVPSVPGETPAGRRGDVLRRWIVRRAGELRGRPLAIDDRIAPSYLLSLVAERGLMGARGLVRFPGRSTRPFVGSRVRLRGKRQLTVGRGVTLGHGCLVDATSTDGVRLGDGVTVGRNTRVECTGSVATLGRGLEVGAGTGLGADSFYGCAGGVRIGPDTIVGEFVSFHSEDHVFDSREVPIRDQGTTHRGIEVGAGCWIGSRVTVLDGARIGDGCVIAAGAVVVAGDYPAYGIYGGVPARLLKVRPGG